MAGGTFVSQNKIRPGAYLNFKSVATPSVAVGSRGIVTLACDLDWGAEGSLIDVYSSELISGDSLAKVGFTAIDSASTVLNLALQNAYMARVYRVNKGGNKANATIGNLTATAKYSGTFGNKIALLIKLHAAAVYTLTTDTAIVSGKTYYTRSGSAGSYIYTAVQSPSVSDIGTYYELTSATKYQVDTYADGYAVDTQIASTVADLTNTDYLTFTGTGALSAAASTLLTSGTNGTSSVANYTEYFNLLKSANWQTLAVVQDGANINASVVTFIRQMREDEGKYVQAVLADYASADYEGIINNINGVVIDGTSIDKNKFTAYIAGATAGATAIESNTGKVIEGATSIVGQLTNDEIITALQNGKLVLSTNQDGTIKIEKDINSLHTFTSDKNYTFSKNRVIRTLDEIGTSICSVWEKTYLGKVSNNDAGRILFKASIVNYLNELQNIGAIQDFDAANVEVVAGVNIDAVVANIAIKPVDSMEILYMTVNVNN